MRISTRTSRPPAACGRRYRLRRGSSARSGRRRCTPRRGAAGACNVRVRFRALVLCQGQVVVFVHTGDVDPHRTRGAVPAVHAVPFPREPAESCQRLRVVALGGCRRTPCERRLDFGPAAASGHHGRHAGARQGVFDALHRCHRLPERRVGPAQQVPAAVRLHHVDRHAFAFAEFVEPLAFGVDVVQLLRIAFVGPERVHVVARRQQVVTGIHREHQHVDQSGPGRHVRDHGVVAAQADVADAPFRPEPQCQLQDRPVQYLPQVGLGIDVVDHAYIDVIRPQPREQVFECGQRFLRIARAQVLPLFPYRAEVPLYDELLAPARQRCADVAAQLGVRSVKVEEVDAVFDCEVEVGPHLFLRPVHKSLAAQRHGADAQSRAAQCPVLHPIPVPRVVLLRAQPDRFAVFERVDAVARLHAFDQVHLAPGRAMRTPDRRTPCPAPRVERGEDADVAHLRVFGVRVAVAVHREVVHHVDVEYLFPAMVCHRLGCLGHRLQKIVLRGQVAPHLGGILGLPGRMYPRLARRRGDADRDVLHRTAEAAHGVPLEVREHHREIIAG